MIQIQHPTYGGTPAIPLPFYGLLCDVCPACGARFWTAERYREHYALQHVPEPASLDTEEE